MNFASLSIAYVIDSNLNLVLVVFMVGMTLGSVFAMWVTSCASSQLRGWQLRGTFPLRHEAQRYAALQPVHVGAHTTTVVPHDPTVAVTYAAAPHPVYAAAHTRA